MAQLNIRRATVDDLPALVALWNTARLPAAELTDRLTEFQVVEADGQFAGAVGLQLCRQHARLHSEDYVDFSVADAAREVWWERLQKVAAHHGVFRLWTQDASPFWTRWGFHPANAEVLEKLPEEWRDLQGNWLTLELKNEEAINQALRARVPDLMAEERQSTAHVANQARRIRLFITVVGFTIGFFCLGLAGWMLLHRSGLAH